MIQKAIEILPKYQRVSCWRKQQEFIKHRCLREVERLDDELGFISAHAGVFDRRGETLPDHGGVTHPGCDSTGARISGRRYVLACRFLDICSVTIGKSIDWIKVVLKGLLLRCRVIAETEHTSRCKAFGFQLWASLYHPLLVEPHGPLAAKAEEFTELRVSNCKGHFLAEWTSQDQFKNLPTFHLTTMSCVWGRHIRIWKWSGFNSSILHVFKVLFTGSKQESRWTQEAAAHLYKWF